MQVCVVYAGRTRDDSRLKAIADAFAHGIGTQGHQVDVINAYDSEARLTRYDYVVSRAVTAMPEFVGWVWKLLERGQRGSLPNGILYLKGGDLAEELARTRLQWRLYEIQDFFTEPFFATKKVVYVQI